MSDKKCYVCGSGSLGKHKESGWTYCKKCSSVQPAPLKPINFKKGKR